MSTPSPSPDRPQGLTADRQVLRQVERSPDAVALTAGKDRLTYRELEQASGRLAGWLRARDIGPGKRVGLAVAPGLARGVALLGILRSGAAYVPLDPAYPRERLAFMAADAEVSLVLASPDAMGLLETAAPTWNVEEVLARDPGGLARDAGLFLPGSAAEMNAPAYLIYTSGSTGRPKGVVLPHRALANLVAWQLGEPGFQHPLRTLQFTPVSFDVHFQEFFSTWATGGELVSVDDALRRDTARLIAFLESRRIERIFLPFVALQQLADVATAYGPIPGALKEVVTAGEQLRVNDVLRDFFRRIPGCRLHNHYGPSETHVVTAHTLEGLPSSWPAVPPIGRPISNVTARLAGEDGREVAQGEPGELWLGGACLASGYWRRPELTAARFLPGPVPGDGPMYRTGDLAQVDDAGAFEFLGRLDDQVKIRGHRVEPGEVEAEILKHPGVRECAVVASEAATSDRQLTAYLVLDSSRPAMAERAQRLREEKVSAWQTVWEGTYAGGGEAPDPSLDLSGWVDSYSGQPIPPADMKEWARGTAQQVLALAPERVLEIGCGTGLMLFRIAPLCSAYHATDFSERAVGLLRERLTGLDLCPDLRLEMAEADDLAVLGSERYDLVLLNSVTQHFPSMDYLLQVLRGAAQRVEKGHIFVGDVTSAHLREAFFTTVEARLSAADEPLGTLRGKVERRLGEEEELVIDPRFFERLGKWLPQAVSVEVRLKPGRYRNELSRYRYDVLIEVGTHEPPALDTRSRGWNAAFLDPGTMDALLREAPDPPVVIHGVPNARVQEALLGAEALRAGEAATVGAWRAQVADRWRASSDVAVEPEELKALVEELGWQASATWGDDPGTFDLLIRPLGMEARPLYPVQREVEHPGSLGGLTSQPLNVALMPSVEAELRRDLQAALPEPMVPGRFELLARLPKTPSGKLDRRALPEPRGRRPVLPHDVVPPRGEMELQLAGIWSRVLGIDEVGATDSFFDLGGNSILSVRVSMAIHEQLARKLPIVTLFQYPTLRTLAAFLERSSESAESISDDSVDERAERQRRALAGNRRFKRT